MNFDNVNINVTGNQSIIKALQNYNTIILKPNIIDNRNVLTQEMISEKHTKYVIKWNYSLEDATINIPKDCIIEFAGGTIDNGIIVGDNTILIYNKPIDEVCLAKRQGTFIYNTTVADEEDITSESGQLKFKDRPSTNGMGRKILRKNIVDGINILTQDMINQSNTIYIIQYDFTLTSDITIPANCILEFDGGSITNGTLIGNNTIFNYYGEFSDVLNNVTVTGSYTRNPYASIEQYTNDGRKCVVLENRKRLAVDYSKVLQRSIDYVRLTNTPPDPSVINDTDVATGSFVIFAINNKIYALKNNIYYSHWNSNYTNTSDFYDNNGKLLDGLFIDDVSGNVRCSFYYKNGVWNAISLDNLENSNIPTISTLILKSSDFKKNTTHIIKYDFLLYSDITLPEGASIEYSTGSIKSAIRNNKTIYDLSNSYFLKPYKNDKPINLFGNVNSVPAKYYNYNGQNYDINVVNEGIDNTGTTDVTEQLNVLFKKHPSATFYFPEGIYKISDTITPYEFGASIIGSFVEPKEKYPNYPRYGTIIKYVADGVRTDRVAVDMGPSFGVIKYVNIWCTTNPSSQSDAISIETSNVPVNGSNAQHFTRVNINPIYKNISGVRTKNICEYVNVHGFSGAGIIIDALNITLTNCFVFNCAVGIKITTSDAVIKNCQLRYGVIGIIYKGFLKVDNCWIDEYSQFGIMQDDSNPAKQTLELIGVHFNHIDFNAVRIKGSSNTNLSGFMNFTGVEMSRIGCYYAGYTTDNIPSGNITDKDPITLADIEYSCKTLASCIYASNYIVNGIFIVHKSDTALLDRISDGQYGGTCGTLLLDAGLDITGCNIITGGKYNDGISVLSNKKSGNFIVYNGTIDN